MNPSTLFENSKREIKEWHLREAKSSKSNPTHTKKKNILKCTLALLSQNSTELNANLSIIDSLNQ